MKRTATLVAILPLVFAGSEAWAQRAPVNPYYDRRMHLQTYAHVGVTAGRLGGPTYGATARIFWPTGHGAMLRVERVLLSGPAFSPGCDACDRTLFTLFDVAYAHRWILSRNGTSQWIASLYEGISIGPRQMDDGVQSRAGRVESGPIDGGAVFGGSVGFRYGSFLIGLDADVRLLATFGRAAVTDDTLFSLRLHVGGDFSIRRGRSR
jgi:hypothetical protein